MEQENVMTQTIELRERELENDYPIYCGYLYVVDDRPWKAPEEMTVGELKKRGNFSSVKNCDIEGRKLWDQAI